MSDVFVFSLFRIKVDENGKQVGEPVKASPHPYSEFKFDGEYIYGFINGFVDVFYQNISEHQKADGIFYVPVLPTGTFNQIERYMNYFIVRIGNNFGAYSLLGDEIVPVSDKQSYYELQEILKRKSGK